MKKFRLSNLVRYFVLNGVNLFVPILIFSSNYRALSGENIATLAVSITINALFFVLIEFGYNTIGVATVVRSREMGLEISLVFNQVLLTRISIFIMAFIAMIIFSLISTKVLSFYIINMITLFGLAISPFWFYQAQEDLRFFTAVTFCQRLFSLILVLSFVKSDSDFILLAIILGVTSVLGSLITLAYAICKYNVKLISLRKLIRLNQYVENFRLLRSRVLVSLYSGVNLLILFFFYWESRRLLSIV